jgi:type IV pilus assembly protein PilB
MESNGSVNPAPSTEPGGEPRLGELLLRENLITSEQLHRALEAQRQPGKYVPLGQILLNQGAIRRDRLQAILVRHGKRARLGEILLKGGAISEEQLEAAQSARKDYGLPLGEMLVKLDYITEESLRQNLAAQMNVRFFDLDDIPLDSSVARYVNPSYAARHLIVPLTCTEDTLVVAMDDPRKLTLVDEVTAGTGLRVEVVLSTAASIRNAYARVYGADLPGTGPAIEHHVMPAERAGSPAVAETLVRLLIQLAVMRRASDIHIETLRRGVQARFRVDGVLQLVDLGTLQEALNGNGRQVISHIKILSNLDIAERRRPQDGSFTVRAERDGSRVSIDLRVSIIPAAAGENAVIRILDPSRAPMSIDALGFCRDVTVRLKRLLQMPSGLVLVTGPTGSGKSSTLFAALRTLYQPGIKVLTAEDPIEYVCEEFSQHEVNDRVGNTFASYLRAFLRHDPEVIMVGEIRDEETAQLAFAAAQTGHLVLSTMHTTDAVSVVSRLRDLDVDPNLVVSSLTGVLSQRLVRRVCGECTEAYEPGPALVEEVFGAAYELPWYRGRGCEACRFTGYRGRVPIAELWTPSDADAVLISRKASFAEIRDSAARSTVFMTEDILEKLRQGKTNLEEIVRTIPHPSLRRLRTGAVRSASFPVRVPPH